MNADPDTVTLRAGLEQFRNDNLLHLSHDATGLTEEAKHFFISHDIAHVLFDCGISLLGEGSVKIWTIFGTTLGFWQHFGAYREANAVTLAQKFTFSQVLHDLWRLIFSIPTIIYRARLMKKPWPWSDFEAYLDLPLSEIREEFNIRPMKKPTKAKLRQREDQYLELAKDIRKQYLDGELDVQRTESGLGYVIHEAGEGISPKLGQKVEVHYVGIRADKAVVFDQSFGNIKGARFKLGAGEVIEGWDEGIALLRWGDEATLFIPPKLGYGPKGRGQDIPPNSELIFYVEIASVG